MFGWCQTGKHAGTQGGCPGTSKRFYFATQRVKRKMQEVIVYRDEDAKCDCYCHSKSDGKSGKKSRKKK